MSKKKSNLIDMTKTGPLSYKQLRELNSLDRTPEVEGLLQAPSGTRADTYDMGKVSYTQSSDGFDDFGSSAYDSELASYDELLNRGDIRADAQPWYAKVSAGLAKGAVLAGTTFLDGTLGLVIGAGTAIEEGRWSGLWDNDFSKVMQSINEWSEKALPNYYTREEQEGPWYENIFTANFLGDKFIKNLGFTVGAFYSGGVTAAGLKVTKLPQIIGTIARSSKAPAMVNTAVGATISAVNEGRIEALNNSKDWFELHKAQLDDSLRERLNTIQAEYEANAGKQLVKSGAEGQVSVDPAYVKYQESLKRERDVYNQALSKLSEDRLKMGNADLLMNIPVLMASNVIQFGKLYANGYKTARKATNIVGRSGKYTAGTTKLGAATAITKGALSEGTEEISQGAASRIAGDYYSTDVNNFYKSKTDPDAAQDTLSWTKSFAKGINETVNDGSAWEEFFIGSLTGALGMPQFRSMRNAEGGLQSPITIKEGAINEWREYNKKMARENEIANYMNNRINSPEFKNYYQGLVRHNKYQNDMNQAAEQGDEFNFKNAEHAQLVSDVAMFDNAGKIEDLYTLIDTAYDTSDENLASIVENTTTTLEDGSKVGPFVDRNGNPMYATPEGKQEMIDKLTENRDEIVNTINNYLKIKNDLDIKTGQQLSDSQLEELTWMKSQIGNWSDRAEDMSGDIKSAIGNVLGNLNSLLGYNERIRDLESENHDDSTDLYREADNNVRSIQGAINTLNLVRNKSDKALAYILSTNPEFVDGLIKEINEVDETVLSEDKKQDVITKLNDIVKLGNASEIYNAKLKEYLKNPQKQVEDHVRADEQAAQQETKRKSDDLRTSLNAAQNLQEFRTIIDDQDDIENRDRVLKEMEDEGNSMAKNYRETHQYNTEVRRVINESDAEPQVKQDAMKLLQDQFNNSENLEQIANPNSIYINNENAFDEDSEDDVDLSTTRFQNAQYELQKAMSRVNNDNRFKGRFSRRYGRPIEVVRQTTEKNGVRITKYGKRKGDKIITGLGTGLSISRRDIPASELEPIEELLDEVDTVMFELLELAEKDGIYSGTIGIHGTLSGGIPFSHKTEVMFDKNPDKLKGDDRTTTGDSGTATIPTVGTSTLPATEVPVGNITQEMVAEENKKMNEKVESPQRPSRDNLNQFYRPAIPELHIEGSKKGDFRPFDVVVGERERDADFSGIYGYLRDSGAFRYVNEGNLKAGDELGFMIDPDFNDHTIFIIDKRNGQVVGSLDESDYSISRYEGLKGLEERIRSEYANRTSQETTTKPTGGKFIATPTTRVSKVMIGRIPYGNAERSLKDVPNVSGEGRAPVFGIIKNGVLTTNSKIDDSLIIKPADMAQKEGRLYLLIPNGAGKYSPSAVRVKHFNNEEFNLDDITIADTPIGKDISAAITKLSNATSQDDVSQAMQDLAQDLYMQDVMVTWFDGKAGSGIVISKKVKNPDGTYKKVIINGREQIKEDKYDVYFSTSKNSSEIAGINFDATVLEDLGDTSSLGTPKDPNDIYREILEHLTRFNLPLQVSTRRINNSAYNNRLVNSGILTSNITDASVRSTWFTTDYFDNEGNLHQAVSPASVTPQPKRKVETPVGGTEGAIAGTKITSIFSNKTYYVDLKTNTIRDDQGKSIEITNDNRILFDLAWAQDNFGGSTNSTIMIDNKVLTPSGQVLDRTAQKYITGQEAQDVKDAIAGKKKEKEGREDRVARSREIISEIYENQKRVDKTRTDGEFYYILEDDGQYHEYIIVHSRLGSNWVESPKQTKELTQIRTKLSQLVDTTAQYSNYLKFLERKYKVSLEGYQGKTDAKSRDTIVNIIRDLMSGTNSMRAPNASTAVNSVIRQYFTIRDISKIVRPGNMTESAFIDLITNLNKIKSNMELMGERFLADNIVLFQRYPDGTRVAGEVDILSIDKDGNFKIYDVKTGRYSFYEFTDRYGHKVNYFTTPSATQRMSAKDYYTLQLSAYKNLFESQYGVPVTKLAVMPFVLSYEKENVSGVQSEKGIPITYNPAVNVPLVGTVKVDKPAVATPAQETLPIYDSSLELQNPIEDLAPEYSMNTGDDESVGYFEIDGKLHKGYMTRLSVIDGIPIEITKVPNITSGFGRQGETAHVASNSYYAVFPNGKTFLALKNNPVQGGHSQSQVEQAIRKMLEGNPQKVKELSAEKTILFDPNAVPTVNTTPITTVVTPATINQSTTQAGAAYTAQKEQAVMEHDDEFEDEFTLKKADETVEVPIWNQEKELKWLSKVLPQLSEGDRVKVVKGLIKVGRRGVLAWGQFDKGVITLSDIAAEGTTYHEAFHVVFNLLLDQNERQFLYDEAKKLYGDKDTLSLEEDMAEGFREYVMTRQNRGLGRRILDFFKELFTKVTNWNNFRPSLISYYQRINEGKYANSDFNDSTVNETRNRLVDTNSNTESLKKESQRFLDNFGITLKEVSEYNDSTPLFDSLNRVINIRTADDISEGVGYAIAFMMQHNGMMNTLMKYKLSLVPKNIRRSLRTAGNYESRGSLKNLTNEVRQRYLKEIGNDIAQELRKLYNLEPINAEPKSFLQTLWNVITEFFNLLTPSAKSKFHILRSYTKNIANSVKLNDASIILTTDKKPGTNEKAEIVNIGTALLENPYEESIVSTLNDNGIALAGSASIALEGTLYRPNENPLHDLDFNAVGYSKEELDTLINEKFPNNIFIREISDEDGKFTETYLVLDRPFESRGELDNISVNSLFDKETGEKIGTWVKSELVLKEGVKGKFLDFFIGENNRPYPNKIHRINNKEYLIANYRNAFGAKIAWSRPKDIWDYNRFINSDNGRLKTIKELREKERSSIKEKLENARIIWGHPAIGKTTYLERNQDILEWDQEVNPKRDRFIRDQIDPEHKLDINSKEYKRLRSDYMQNWKSHPEYVDFLTREWNNLKKRAIDENKRLFASPLPLLEIAKEDFDLFINIPEKDFLKRNVDRGGGHLDSLGWKQTVNDNLIKVNQAKIITTSEYFSDFMRNNLGVQWGTLTEEEAEMLERKGWTAEEFNSISQEERDQAIKCIAF